MARTPILIEGCTTEEILALPDDQLDALILLDKPVVVSTGSAEILGQMETKDSTLVVVLSHIDGGGEGVLPTITALLARYAKLHEFERIEWIVHAVNCAKPNPKLRRVLERRGFKVENHRDHGAVFRLVEGTGRE